MQNSENSVTMRIEELMGTIQKRTELSDWGDNQFLVPLLKLGEAFEETKQLHSIQAGEFFWLEIERLLTNRLVIQNELKLHPDVLEIPIEHPIFIIGLARSGTTLLHNLLAQDPSARAPLYFEMRYPIPPGGLANLPNRDADSRIGWVERGLVQHNNSSKRKLHELHATSPEECHNLIMHTFMTHTFNNDWYVPSYGKWLAQQDMMPAYCYEKVLLQILLRQKTGEHLVLKDPMHLDFLESIIKVFPTANFIWIHRDPIKVVSSFLDLARVILKRDFPITELISNWRKTVENGIKMRNQLNQKQFFDVYYHDLVRNPLEVIGKTYGYFDYPWTSDFEENIAKWLKENPKNKHGVHQHSLEMFGVEAAQVQNEFADYIRYFSIPSE